MRKTLFLFAVVVVALGGCGQENALRKPRGGDTGGLSDADYNMLADLNVLQTDNIAARKLVYNHTFIADSASEKVTKLAKLIGDNCAGNPELPEEEMTGAENNQVVDGSTCPIRWARSRTYNSGSRSFYYLDDFTSLTKEFQELSPILRRMVRGSITRVLNGSTVSVSGTIRIEQFNIQGKGPVSGTISLQSEYLGTRGSGTIVLALTVYGRSRFTGSINWESPRFDPKYYINGKETDLKVFEEVFSAFDLTKIMANSLKMR